MRRAAARVADVRAVLDANILISSLLSRRGAPAAILSRWLTGEFEIVASERLLAELRRALAYGKLRARIAPGEADAFVSLLRGGAIVVADPPARASRSRDPGDDYLIALAEAERAFLVTGDADLLELAADLPILTARAFLERLA